MLPHIAVISVNDKAGNVIEPCELNRDSSKSCARPPSVAAAFQPQNASGENLPPSWCLSDVCVKDHLPFSVLFLPNGGGAVGAGLVFPVVGAFNRYLIGCDNCIESVGHDFV